jgi:flagellar FliJ protein
MTFRFRFASLLELRRRARDLAGSDVGKAHEAIRRIDEQREDLNRQRIGLRESSGRKRTGRISVDRLLAAGRYDMQLEAEQQSLVQTRGELIQELARRQQKLAEAESEVKRLEKLQQRDEQRYRIELQRREQAEIDDRCASRHALTIQRRSRS